MEMAGTMHKIYIVLVIMTLLGLSNGLSPAQSVPINIECADKNPSCASLNGSCTETRMKENCTLTCGLCRQVVNVWKHLHNLLELPYEDRTVPRGDNNYVYILDNENPPLPPDVNKVVITALPNITSQIKPKILLQPRGTPPAPFDPEVKERIKLLVDFFTDSKDDKQLLIYAVNLKDHINEDIFVKALRQTLQKPKFQKIEKENRKTYSRSDADTNSKKEIDVLMHSRSDSFPKHFVKKSTFSIKFRSDDIEEDECVKESNLRNGCRCERWPGWQESNDVETKVAYWREDRDLNNFHYRWHEYNERVYDHEASCDDPEYRHGELFGYFHQQLIARYDMERLSNGLSRVKSLDGWIHNIGFKIPEGYFADLENIRNRCPYQTVTQVMSHNISYEFDRVSYAIGKRMLKSERSQDIFMRGIQGYSMLSSVMERDGNCAYGPFSKIYGHLGIHNLGHIEISKLGCDGAQGTYSHGPMNYLDVCCRDPVFWRWHKFVDETLQKYADNIQPYRYYELISNGVEVTDFNVQDISGAINKLQTHRSYIETNYTFEKEVYCIYQPELNHDPFDYKISINNQAEPRKKVNIRIYLAPVFNEDHKEFTFDEQRNLWALMDRFSLELNYGHNEIKRGSCHSTITTMPPLTKEEISEKIAEQSEPGWPIPDEYNTDDKVYDYYYDYGIPPVFPALRSIYFECEDKDPRCPYVKHLCKNVTWVIEDCKKACGLCVEVPLVNGCVDEYADCQNYIDNCKKGSRRYDHMAKNCRKTCGFCNTGSGPPKNRCMEVGGYCTEGHRQCDGELQYIGCSRDEVCCIPGRCPGGCGDGICLRSGKCECNDRFAGPNCEKEFIVLNQRKILEVDSVCKDENSQCYYNATYDPNFCNILRNNFKFNADMCRKSCGICSTACKDTLEDCQLHKYRGLCETNTIVQEKCPKTCFDCMGVRGVIPCQCGLPHHLLLPKGKEEGMAFKLFVLVTPYYDWEEDVDCAEADCSVLCAMQQLKCIGHRKGEAMAFPFDRKLEKLGATRIRRIEDLDWILPNAKVQNIDIYYKDEVKNEQRCT